MSQIRMNRPAAEQGVLAFVLPYSDRRRWLSGYHRLLAGAEQRAAALGYRVEVFGFADSGMTTASLKESSAPGQFTESFFVLFTKETRLLS